MNTQNTNQTNQQTAFAMYAAAFGEKAAKRNERRCAVLADVIASHGAANVTLQSLQSNFRYRTEAHKALVIATEDGTATILGSTTGNSRGDMEIVYAAHSGADAQSDKPTEPHMA